MALVIMRHGATAATPDRGRPRASGPDLPLAKDARKVLDATIKRLPQVDKIYTSELQRATQTATEWSKKSGAPIAVHPGLDSWNLGRYKGQHSTAADAVARDLVKHPDRKAPGGGESFHAFLARLLPVVLPLVRDAALHGMVGHSRSIKALHAYLKGRGQVTPEGFEQAPLLNPGQAVVATPQGMKEL